MIKWIQYLALSLCAVFISACDDKSSKSDLLIYTSLIERDMHAFLDTFHAKHPNIQVRFFRSDTTDLVSKLDAEFLAGQPKPDIILLSDDIVMSRFRDQDRLLPLLDIDVSAFPRDSYDPTHTFFGTIYQGTGLICHTEFEHKPTQSISFWDLTQPHMHKALVMPSPMFSGSASFNLSLLAENSALGWPFWKALLHKNKPLLVKGNGAVLDTVVKKGRMCGLILDCLALPAIHEGAGLTFHYFTEGVPIIREPVAVLKHTDKAETAKIFVRFILSEEGQRELSRLGYRPLHKGVKAQAMYDTVPMPKQLEADPTKILERLESDRDLFFELYG